MSYYGEVDGSRTGQDGARGDQSQWNAMMQDNRANVTSGSYWARGGLGSPGNLPHVLRGHDAWRDNREAYETAQWNASMANASRQRAGLYNTRRDLLNRMQWEQDSQRSGALDALGRAYASPDRAAAYRGAYDARLGDSLAGLNYDYGRTSQKSAQQMARRGRLGSSHDAETQAQQANAWQLGALDAEQGANEYAQGLSDSDFQQQQALMRALLAGDSQAALAYQGMASSATNEAGRIGTMGALGARQQLLSQQYANAQSGQYGAYGRVGANAVYSGYGVGG